MNLQKEKELLDIVRCECGTKKEDLSHVVYRCRKFEEERDFMLKKMMKEKNEIRLDIDGMIIEND